MKCDFKCTMESPIRVRQYPFLLNVHEMVEKEIEAMLLMGVIKRSRSPYNAPVVMVKKPYGTSRFCIDFRRLNDRLVADSEPIPPVDVTIAKVGRKRFFSKLDLAKGYWPIPMEKTAKGKTAFSSSSGLYHFNFMPFGLKTASATFTKLMGILQGDIPDAHHYTDDVLVATDTWEEHVYALRSVFERLCDAGLTVKPKKCEVGFEEIGSLGYKLGLGQIAPNREIVTRIQDAPRPTTKRQVRSFLGLTGF